MYKGIVWALTVLCLTACGNTALTQELAVENVRITNSLVKLVEQDVPHTRLTMLIPEGWVSDYYQGNIIMASKGDNFFYSPFKPFEGVLINMFVSDGPRAVGASFDVLGLANDFIATGQPKVIRPPTLVERSNKQVVTTIYENTDSKGKLITYLAGFVLEQQQLTVFLAATPSDNRENYLPILEKMLYSITVKNPSNNEN